MAFAFSRALPLVIGLSLSVPAVADVPVQDPEHTFYFTLPSGFEPDPTLLAQPNVVSAHRSAPTSDDPYGTVIAVKRVPYAIPEDDPMIEAQTVQLPGGTYMDNWGSIKVLVGRVVQEAQGVPFITLNALVPLSPRSISLSVLGPATREPELRTLLHATLVNLHGTSTNSARKKARSEAIGTLLNKVLGFALLLFLLFKLRSWFAQRSP